MALGKEIDLSLQTVLPGVEQAVTIDAIGRLDELRLDTRAKSPKLELVTRLYATPQAVLDSEAIPNADDTLVFGAEAVPAVEPVLDPETNDVLDPGSPAIPSLAQLLAQPIMTNPLPELATLNDVYDLLRREIYLRIPLLRSQWEGATEV